MSGTRSLPNLQVTSLPLIRCIASLALLFILNSHEFAVALIKVLVNGKPSDQAANNKSKEAGPTSELISGYRQGESP
jgi:hypothetical protein